ncbi:lipase family protein [Nocardia nova]|uniref:lipase family protein n=1 Tax=Nocardia nova TaxID=37330 RepID=UPI0033C6A8A7
MTDNAPDFYAAPVVGDDLLPGRLLRIRPTDTPGVIGAGRAWTVLYSSTDTQGEATVASGIVIAPDTDERLGTGPILVYCPGFHGLGGRCAPSQLLAEGSEPETAPIEAALERGWTVAVADGENLGVTGRGPHTFLARTAAGQIALDLARAATSIPELHDRGAPVVMWGYGDGARAALAAVQLHDSYAPEIALRAVAAGAAISDPDALVSAMNHSPYSGLVLAGFLGLSRAYHHLPLRHVLSEDGQRVVEDAEKASAAVLLEQYRRPFEDWCDRSQPWTDPMWRYVLAREKLVIVEPTSVPVHLYHGTRDSVIPLGQTLAAFPVTRADGAEVSWRLYEADHVNTARLAVPEVVARLAGYLQRPSLW